MEDTEEIIDEKGIPGEEATETQDENDRYVERVKKVLNKMIQRRNENLMGIGEYRPTDLDCGFTDIKWEFFPTSSGGPDLKHAIAIYFVNKKTQEKTIKYLKVCKASNQNIPIVPIFISAEKMISKKISVLSLMNTKLNRYFPSYQTFLYTDLLIDPTEHMSCPKFSLSDLPYDKNLPVLFTTDKICRFLGLVDGQIVKVVRTEYVTNSQVMTTVVYKQVKRND